MSLNIFVIDTFDCFVV